MHAASGPVPRRHVAMEEKMADGKNEAPYEELPLMQRLLDNHFLLLFLGVASPGLLYILWGIIDIMNTPLAR
jgi:hypothetical protein